MAHSVILDGNLSALPTHESSRVESEEEVEDLRERKIKLRVNKKFNKNLLESIYVCIYACIVGRDKEEEERDYMEI